MFWTASPPTLFTDFNSKTAAGLVKAIPEHGLALRLEPGAEVRIEDADGNSCQGVVHEALGGGYLVVPVWSTWTVPVGAQVENRTSTREAIPA